MKSCLFYCLEDSTTSNVLTEEKKLGERVLLFRMNFFKSSFLKWIRILAENNAFIKLFSFLCFLGPHKRLKIFQKTFRISKKADTSKRFQDFLKLSTDLNSLCQNLSLYIFHIYSIDIRHALLKKI